MSTLTAAELKRRGVSALTPVLRKEGEAIITVHGKARYVVMTAEKYDTLRELELSEAVREARADYNAGRIADNSVKKHLQRIENEI
ncbi:MAG: type II toxin-antitoxin system prevent-host-death family antitoxin [Kiritimatiellae bacterium]|nr:type II toxin-antitoxin system prevent-host-death family antitoxin [Kiritimatiellia bacterium]MDD5521823.1 type II toxin-antitoxin system prevent-host-death family antitoxin [Kiritimatiellia bacterium]